MIEHNWRRVGQDRLERAVSDTGVEIVEAGCLHLDHYIVGTGTGSGKSPRHRAWFLP